MAELELSSRGTIDMTRSSGEKKVGRISPWVLFVATVISATIVNLGILLLSSGVQKAIALFVGLTVGVLISLVGALKTFKPE
ncbi:MAG TPA: hypothetical protein VHT75_00140 [Acidimicrobiales bacterium]|jgi:uncharacterized membrane protein|nr:hypothetical protein [Acidimicrobiales bacterium]